MADDTGNPGKPSTSIKSPTSPTKSNLSDSDLQQGTNSSSTDTGGDCVYDDLTHDMMASSYTEISFGESDLEDCGDIEEYGNPSESDKNKSKQIPCSLSLPQLSSTIVDWSEKAKAEYETEYGDGPGASSTIGPPGSSKDASKQLEGNVEYSNDGMIIFVAHDLEQKLRLSSVASSPCNSSFADEPSSAASATLNPILLNRLESQARTITQNLNQVMQHISNYTHQVTSLTLDSIKNYEKCLFQSCDSIDSNIKSMYQLMAKYEELTNVMSPINKLSDEIKEVKRLLTLFEKEMESNRFQ